MAPAHWLYPVNESSDYYLETDSGERLRVTPENLWSEIQANPDRSDSWSLSSGYRSLRMGDHLWIYSGGAHQFICALGHVVQVEQDRAGRWHAILVWDLEATLALKGKPLERAAFHQIPQQPQRANSYTQHYLDRWLVTHQIRHSAANEQALSTEDLRLKVLATIVQRRGQSEFRRTLLRNYGGRCCATGETAEAVLEAAHITPYLGPQSHRASNGLLLRADLHTLFDLHLIGIDKDGRWAVSSQLDGTSYAELRGKRPRAPKSDPPSRAELRRHFARFCS